MAQTAQAPPANVKAAAAHAGKKTLTFGGQVCDMQTKTAEIRPEDWMCRIFQARAAAAGGVVRRKTRDIDRIVGYRRFLDEIDRRGFHVVENAGQTVIFCNQEPVRILR